MKPRTLRFSQILYLPERQSLQVPQTSWGVAVAFMPSSMPYTPSPIATTSPEYSWPCTVGYFVKGCLPW